MKLPYRYVLINVFLRYSFLMFSLCVFLGFFRKVKSAAVPILNYFQPTKPQMTLLRLVSLRNTLIIPHVLLISFGHVVFLQFNDKTPYTIMFGPDKCGNDIKMHFIFRHVNPINGSITEKHCKKPK